MRGDSQLDSTTRLTQMMQFHYGPSVGQCHGTRHSYQQGIFLSSSLSTFLVVST